MDAAFLCRQRDVKILDLQLEQAGQQLGIIDLGAMVSRHPRLGRYARRRLQFRRRIAPMRDYLDRQSFAEDCPKDRS
jgi:hypothetical protein